MVVNGGANCCPWFMQVFDVAQRVWMDTIVGSSQSLPWMVRTDGQNSGGRIAACIVSSMDSIVETSPETPSKIIYPEDDLNAHTDATEKVEEPTTPGTVAFPVNAADEFVVETKETQNDADVLDVEAETSPAELEAPQTKEPEVEVRAREESEVPTGPDASGNDNNDAESTEAKQENDSTDVPPPPPSEPADADAAAADSNPFEEHIARAVKAKQEATEAYKKSDLMTARLNYLIALEALQQVQGDLSNKTKATLFEHTVTNNNNVALCSLGLEEYGQAVAFATNVVVLISSLERNMPDGQVWKNLSENGITEDQLLKVWKKKAYYYLGKAHLKRGNQEEAIKAFESALALIADDSALVVNSNELRTLIANAKAELSKQTKKQKKTWSKAFEKRKLEPDAPEDSNTSPAPSAPTTPLGKTSAGAFDPNNLNFDLGLKKDGKTAKSSSNSSGNSGKPASTAVSTWTWSSDMVLWTVLGAVSLFAGLAFWQRWRYSRHRF